MLIVLDKNYNFKDSDSLLTLALLSEMQKSENSIEMKKGAPSCAVPHTNYQLTLPITETVLQWKLLR